MLWRHKRAVGGEDSDLGLRGHPGGRGDTQAVHGVTQGSRTPQGVGGYPGSLGPARVGSAALPQGVRDTPGGQRTLTLPVPHNLALDFSVASGAAAWLGLRGLRLKHCMPKNSETSSGYSRRQGWAAEEVRASDSETTLRLQGTAGGGQLRWSGPLISETSQRLQGMAGRALEVRASGGWWRFWEGAGLGGC